MSEPHCLRCESVALDTRPGPAGIAFFECPRCRRRYAQTPGKGLTFRWGHPISFALYPVIFEARPDEAPDAEIDAAIAATAMGEVAAAIAEIRLELASPSQNVGEILDCVAPEAALRRYLERFCERAESGAA